ncbi:hypothetical protein, partial [Burkholderia pseudomallei]|uniref:hypothetical protein n=6 Tax=Burkholderia pseudomallei TaxID=28450 RepID=UPI001C7E945D
GAGPPGRRAARRAPPPRDLAAVGSLGGLPRAPARSSAAAAVALPSLSPSRTSSPSGTCGPSTRGATIDASTARNNRSLRAKKAC